MPARHRFPCYEKLDVTQDELNSGSGKAMILRVDVGNREIRKTPYVVCPGCGCMVTNEDCFPTTKLEDLVSMFKIVDTENGKIVGPMMIEALR